MAKHAAPHLFDYPKARADGPKTSREAAESISLQHLNRLQRAIVGAFRLASKPMTDELLVDRLRWTRAAPSSIRSRRQELVRLGILEVADSEGTTAHGRRCRRFRMRRP